MIKVVVMGFSRKRTGKDGKSRYTAYYLDLRGQERSAGTFSNKKDANDAWKAAEAQVLLPGIGPVLGAVICAEIGDITRFRTPGQLCSWAGLTPRHYESDTKVIRGHVSKQGSRMLRWAVIEAIQRQPAGTRPQQVKDAIIARRSTDARRIAKTAAARQLLTQVFYVMRDGYLRRLTSQAA